MVMWRWWCGCCGGGVVRWCGRRDGGGGVRLWRLLAGGYLEDIVVVRNIITLFRLAIGSSVGKNIGTTNPESSDVGDLSEGEIEEEEEVVELEEVGIVKFTNGVDKVAYKMLHKIEQFRSLSNIKKEHKQSVYFRKKEDMKRGLGYVMEKIFGFYKECLELGPEYKTNKDKDSSVSLEGFT
ncbi:hypothetical protein Tco_0539435 [Tanacetum coccineum]